MKIKITKTETKTANVWLPNPRESRFGQTNPNYAQSLVVGVVSPIFHLPYIFGANVLIPFITGTVAMFGFVFTAMAFGIFGRATGERVVSSESVPLTEPEIEKELDMLLRGTGYIAVKTSDIPTLVSAGVKMADRVLH